MERRKFLGALTAAPLPGPQQSRKNRLMNRSRAAACRWRGLRARDERQCRVPRRTDDVKLSNNAKLGGAQASVKKI